MDYYLYHFQGIIYWVAGLYLLLKFFVNYLVHRKLDTYVHNLEKFEGVGHYGDNSKTYFSQQYEQGLLYFFTTWWDVLENDSKYLRRAKRLSNFLNITSILLIVGLVLFFLNMQEVNFQYGFIKEDPWQFVPT